MHKKLMLLQNKLDTISKYFKRQLSSLKDASNSYLSNEKLVEENEILKAQAFLFKLYFNYIHERKGELISTSKYQRCVFKKNCLRYNPIIIIKSFTQISLLRHQHLQNYVFLVVKIDFMKNIAFIRILQLKPNLFRC